MVLVLACLLLLLLLLMDILQLLQLVRLGNRVLTLPTSNRDKTNLVFQIYLKSKYKPEWEKSDHNLEMWMKTYLTRQLSQL